MILHCLLEGNSVRSTARLCDVEPKTVLTMLKLAGENCERIMGRMVVNIPVTDVQCDEIWGFVQKKEAHKYPWEANDNSIGDAYCFVAIERESKLILNFALGRRDQATTDTFIEGLRAATAPQRFQITTDGFQPDATPKAIMGKPDKARICTSHVERQNLSIRMGMRRMTRLTNAFSKKWENLWAAYCLWFAFYNFCRIHQALRVTPAMQAGITDRVWDLENLISSQ
jgi:IS1 family transposase